MGMGWGMFLWPIVFMLIIVSLYFGFVPRRDIIVNRENEALEIARMRYARGEITAEEFEEIKKRLK